MGKSGGLELREKKGKGPEVSLSLKCPERKAAGPKGGREWA